MARSKGQPGVLIFWELFDVLEALPGDDAKNMLSAIRGYIQHGAIPDFGDRQALTYLWLVVQPKLDADTERYEKKREQCHDAVMSRWEKERQKAVAGDNKSIRSYTDESERIRKPYVDPAFENNIILTQTERLTMNNRPKDPKTARNKNVLIVGGSGSGKTRFWLKPNLLQCTSKTYPTSFVVTDPKGDIVVSCGHALQKNGYQIKMGY